MLSAEGESSVINKPKWHRNRYTNWVFTSYEVLDFTYIYNNYSDIIRYVGYGLEKCPTTDRLHQQGFIQFYSAKRMSDIKRIFGNNKVYLNRCFADEVANVKYCSKEGNYTCFGKFVTRGHRTDLELIRRDIMNGNNMDQISFNYFNAWIQYRRSFQQFANICDKVATKNYRTINVVLLSGPTGYGKTAWACSFPNYYKINGNGLEWFDGYNGEKILIIDEYSNDTKITDMLGLLDGYQCRLPIKGGFTYAKWDKVLITTNLRPHEIHEQAKPEHRRALFRRINTCISFWEIIEKPFESEFWVRWAISGLQGNIRNFPPYKDIGIADDTSILLKPYYDEKDYSYPNNLFCNEGMSIDNVNMYGGVLSDGLDKIFMFDGDKA